MFEALDPAPTEDEVFTMLVNKLKQDIWQEFQGWKASRIQIHETMLCKWFGRVSGTHFTRAFKELEDEGKIIHRSGARSKPYTQFTFKK